MSWTNNWWLMCVWFVDKHIGDEEARAIAEALKVNKTVQTIELRGKWVQSVLCVWAEFELNLFELIDVVIVDLLFVSNQSNVVECEKLTNRIDDWCLFDL